MTFRRIEIGDWRLRFWNETSNLQSPISISSPFPAGTSRARHRRGLSLSRERVNVVDAYDVRTSSLPDDMIAEGS